MDYPHIEWKYFYLTSAERLSLFEQDRAVLQEGIYALEVEEIIEKLQKHRTSNSYDLAFMNWMTKESIQWKMTKEISEEAQDFSLMNKSLKYLHSLLGNLFSYHNLFQEHQKYCFIKHGYPVRLTIPVIDYLDYVIYKEGEDLYESVIVSDGKLIKQILDHIKLMNLPLILGDLNSESLLVLQYENE